MLGWLRRLVGGADPSVTDGRPVFVRCNEYCTHYGLARMVLQRDTALSEIDPACRGQVEQHMMQLLNTPEFQEVHYDK